MGADRQGRRPRRGGRPARSRQPSRGARVPLYVVILAGGGGTRLWPLSRPERPKPFLPLLGEPEPPPPNLRAADPASSTPPTRSSWSTDRRYGDLVRDELPELSPAQVVGEPVGRNTAAAIALVALAIERPPDDVMVVLPADAHVANEPEFRAVLAAAARVGRAAGQAAGDARDPPGRTGHRLRLRRRRRAAARDRAGHAVYRVERFVEKPTRAAAEMLLRGPHPAFWNAGIFVWRRDAIVDALARHAPEVFEPLRRDAPGARRGAGGGVSLTRTRGPLGRLRRDGAGGRRGLRPGRARRRRLERPRELDRAPRRPAGRGPGGDRPASGLGRQRSAAGSRIDEHPRPGGRPAGRHHRALRYHRGRHAGSRCSVCAADRAQDVRGIAEELQRSKERDS